MCALAAEKVRISLRNSERFLSSSSPHGAQHKSLSLDAGTMARSIRLFLIRHGETVDNVAQLYRDSQLTNHGFLQATRLGAHFQATGLSFTHLFSSHLQRAAKTAGKIREAQLARPADAGRPAIVPHVVQLPLLMEQDFGSMEGKKWYDRPPESKASAGERPGLKRKSTTDFVDMESKESMARRADTFLDGHFMTLLDDASTSTDCVVAIVSHGLFLSTLWKRLLLRLPPKSVAMCSELQGTARPSLEHLGGWANTGYLELHMTRTLQEEPTPTEDVGTHSVPEPFSLPEKEDVIGRVGLQSLVTADETADAKPILDIVTLEATPTTQPSLSRVNCGWTTTIVTINGTDHLKGLKRTGGGVGSSRHDTSQKSILTFFKRRKVE